MENVSPLKEKKVENNVNESISDTPPGPALHDEKPVNINNNENNINNTNNNENNDEFSIYNQPLNSVIANSPIKIANRYYSYLFLNLATLVITILFIINLIIPKMIERYTLWLILIIFLIIMYSFLSLSNVSTDISKFISNEYSGMNFFDYIKIFYNSKINLFHSIKCFHYYTHKGSKKRRDTFSTNEYFNYDYSRDITGNININFKNLYDNLKNNKNLISKEVKYILLQTSWEYVFNDYKSKSEYESNRGIFLTKYANKDKNIEVSACNEIAISSYNDYCFLYSDINKRHWYATYNWYQFFTYFLPLGWFYYSLILKNSIVINIKFIKLISKYNNVNDKSYDYLLENREPKIQYVDFDGTEKVIFLRKDANIQSNKEIKNELADINIDNNNNNNNNQDKVIKDNYLDEYTLNNKHIKDGGIIINPYNNMYIMNNSFNNNYEKNNIVKDNKNNTDNENIENIENTNPEKYNLEIKNNETDNSQKNIEDVNDKINQNFK